MDTQEFIKKIENGEAKVLTVEVAKSLKGKRIAWMYFGYRENLNTVEELTVGDIVSELDYQETQPLRGYKSKADYWRSYMTPRQLDEAKTKLLLLNDKGENVYICAYPVYDNYFEEPTFTCSDADREVYYIELYED